MIHEKLYKFQAEVGRLKKDKVNGHFKNSYVDINTVLDEVIPVLHELKILLTQPLTFDNGGNSVVTTLTDVEDDTSISFSVKLQDNLDAQKLGSAITYIRRYSLVSLLGLQTVDDDGKAGSNSVKDNKTPTNEMIKEINELVSHDNDFKSQWLNFLNVSSFDKASYSQIEKALKALRK